MNNRVPTNQAQRYKAYVSSLGTTQIHSRNPYIIAWWSAAFPGFGHLLLSKYLRGLLLFTWEVIVNVNAHLNDAMVYTFTGQIEQAKDVLEPGWAILYIPMYIYAIWDSYRTAVDLNKVYVLAEREDADYNTFTIGAMEINYLDKRLPWLAAMWSYLAPGLGQLYIHRIVVSFFVVIWWIVIAYNSHLIEAAATGIESLDLSRMTAKLDAEWLLFMPSIYGFAIYDAYVNTVEDNKLFRDAQKKVLRQRYQQARFKMPGDIGLEKR